tara:strand:+ start:303 stop:668 length:366 start_codon:yes stop_codon:yes gene_type:complete
LKKAIKPNTTNCRKDKIMQFVNLTPHTLNIHSNGNVTDITPSGAIARVSTSYNQIETVAGINVYSCVYGSIDGLPEAQDNKIFVVSGVVKSAVPNREDVMSPGELIRDENGKPVGSNGLRR